MQILTAIEVVVRARCCMGSVTLQHAWIEGEKGRMVDEKKRRKKREGKRRGKGTKEKAVASRAVAFFSRSFFRDSSRPWFPGFVEIHQVFKRAYARWKRRDTALVSSEQKGGSRRDRWREGRTRIGTNWTGEKKLKADARTPNRSYKIPPFSPLQG